MYRREISGQFLYFGMFSALSGNAVTGIAAAVSGRVSADGGSQAVVAGSISEVGGGQYRLNMFTNDTSGKTIGFLFSSSGCIPVSLSIVTDDNVSGRITPVSGQVYIASGNPINIADAVLMRNVSGVQTTLPIHSLGTIILATTQYTIISGNTWIVYRTDGTTQHLTRTLASASGASPITGVS